MDERKPTRPKVMSIKEFGKTYGLSRSSVYNLMYSGQLLSIKVGKRRLIPVDAAERWFASACDANQAG